MNYDLESCCFDKNSLHLDTQLFVPRARKFSHRIFIFAALAVRILRLVMLEIVRRGRPERIRFV